MSYILDALKKSEEQRNGGAVTVPTSHARQLPAKKPKPSFIFFLALLVLLFFVLTFFYINQSRKTTTNHANTSEAAQQPLTATQSASDLRAVYEKKAQLKLSDKPFDDAYANADVFANTHTIKPETLSPTGSAGTQREHKQNNQDDQYPHVQNLSEADPFIQNQIPALNYSSHWFDSEAKNSTIIINNRSLKEGAWVNNKIQIERILADETIFKIENSKFKLRSLQNWSV